MNEPLNIVDVEIIQGCGIVVTFSDGTAASYAGVTWGKYARTVNQASAKIRLTRKMLLLKCNCLIQKWSCVMLIWMPQEQRHQLGKLKVRWQMLA